MRPIITLFFVMLFVVWVKPVSSNNLDLIHPYHVGSVEFNYNPNTKTFEILGKFFTDDLENGLNRKFGTNLHFFDKNADLTMNQYLEKYLLEFLKLKVNGKMLKVHYIGFEESGEAVKIYLESEAVSSPKNVEASVSVLYNLFDDQINIIHVIVNGKRQSHKLSYPDRYLQKKF